ncbi:beta-ketoacyl synthase N-terminal-like domain-containing protein [Nocardia sp. NPDC049149]|uniref:beta-ketoacyl synthase N-terminal-like domain-containing protein n=1 Tax=Nocardia sp. NPDC049149 TaxID=3364315 RepID=UPI003712A9FA
MSDNVFARGIGERCSAAVAVIGLACSLAGADNPESYWDVLCDVAAAIPPTSPDPWQLPPVDRHAPDRPDGTGEFDAAMFGLSAHELAALDPETRLVLELGWAAMEDSGTPPEVLRDAEAAVFLGGDQAVRLAYQSLRSGVARLALADNVHLHPGVERALGFARGSARVAVLKRLADAVADGDTVYYVLVGGGAGRDGAPPTVPDAATQRALLQAAYAGAELASAS